MGRKVFLSILGTGPYSECTYAVDEKPVLTTRYIQMATLKYLVEKGRAEKKEWISDDKAVFFLTTKSETDQWTVGKTKDGVRAGLQEELNNAAFPFKIEPKHIDDGKNVTEIWNIFDAIYVYKVEYEDIYGREYEIEVNSNSGYTVIRDIDLG